MIPTKTSASTSNPLGIRRYQTRVATVEAVPWTGHNLQQLVRFVGQRRLEGGHVVANFRAYAGFPPAPYAGGELYDSELNLYVPIEIGEWVLKDSPTTFRIIDPLELSELYRKIQ